jgi:hypothetical protein
VTNNEKLAHSLKMQFGTAPTEPTASQLTLIKAAILAVQKTGRQPTDSDWRAAVALNCPGAGRYKYAGVDNSDLNTLLALATQAAGS